MKKYLIVSLQILLVAGCKHSPPAKAETAKEEKLSVTDWTDKTELFMEYPPLVAGEKGRYAVHLTQLSDFKPVGSGQVEVTLRAEDGSVETFRAEGPSKPGIFGVDVTPKKAGTVSMAVSLSATNLRDTHDIGQVQVFPDKNAATIPAEKPTEETIPFLKEQQWALDFATEVIRGRRQRGSFDVPGEVTPRTGGEGEVSAPFNGRLVGSQVPAIGTSVEKGQELVGILPPTNSPGDPSALELSRAEAETALQLASKDLGRVERLFSAGAVPGRRVDEAKAAEATAQARLRAAQSRLEQYESSRTAEGAPRSARIFSLRAPISGVIAEATATTGANVEMGQKLFKIVDVDSVYVSGHVPEASLTRLRQLSGAELHVGDPPQTRPVQRLISVGRLVDPVSRTVSVIYEINNTNRLLAVGQAVNLRLFTSTEQTAPAVPDSAIVDDAGRPIVFLQKEGETFVRRAVKLGSRAANYVQVIEGVKAGERVVSRGAYLIRLSTMSSQVPAHGHVH